MTIQSNCFVAPEDIDLKAAQDEWDAVATITIGDPTRQATGDSADGESVPNFTKPVAAPNVTFTQAIDHFQTHTDLVIYKVREHFWITESNVCIICPGGTTYHLSEF